MKFHREGRTIISLTIFIFLVINAAAIYALPPIGQLLFAVASVVLAALVVQFFRVPKRPFTIQGKQVVCPADGKIVVIEKTKEHELLGDDRIQVSIFMSPLNVHINWFPVSGQVTYSKNHKGSYLVAWHPKSSLENERTTVAVKHASGHTVLFRQIAGAVARRIICYAKEGQAATAGAEFGFIKFGSRVDVFLPLGSEIKVAINEHVKGSQTILAVLP